jgi:hypothetical protein
MCATVSHAIKSNHLRFKSSRILIAFTNQTFNLPCTTHRNLIGEKIPLHGVYLCCRVCTTDSAPIYIMVVKDRNTTVYVPLHRSFNFTGGQRSRTRPFPKEHSLYLARCSQKAVYKNYISVV